jgi:hypothetical protein
MPSQYKIVTLSSLVPTIEAGTISVAAGAVADFLGQAL